MKTQKTPKKRRQKYCRQLGLNAGPLKSAPSATTDYAMPGLTHQRVVALVKKKKTLSVLMATPGLGWVLVPQALSFVTNATKSQKSRAITFLSCNWELPLVRGCSMATIWWENKFSICRPMNLVKRYYKNPTLLIPLCKRAALDAGVESFFSIVKIQGPRNPFIAFPILNFSLMKKRQKIHFFPLQVHHPAPLNVTCKHKWTICLDGMPNSRRAVIQPLEVSMPFCASMVGILM